MTLQEAGALELLKDIENKDNHGVQLSDIAPDPEQNIGQYNAVQDPEMKQPETTAPLSESTSRYAYLKKLVEAKNDAITMFLKSGADDVSYEAFENSEYFDDAKNRKGELCSKAEYIAGVKWLLKNGKIDADDVGNALAGAKSLSKDPYSIDTSDDDGPYRRGEDWDAENYSQSETLSQWVSDYADTPGVQNVNEVFENLEDIVREIVTGIADKRHSCCCGDPGVGKTYTVRKTVEKYVGDSGKKLVYSAGAMSPSITSVAPFFFYHKDNEIIILDDNDKVLMKSCDQNTQNFMKAVLDPSAMEKPVTLAPKYVKMSQSNLDDYAAQDLDESVNVQGVKVDIDMEALKEGFFRYSINGDVKDCFKLSEADKLTLSNMISSKKLKEAFDDEDEENLFGDDDDEELEGDVQSNITMEPSFVFNSSVIFISNLKLKDISSAVADRCECIEISLTLPQFMERLESVIGGLCQGEKYSSRPQWLRNWGKQSAYTAFLGVVEAFNSGATLFGRKVMIRRKFTFRLFEEMANEWCRLASAYALRHSDLHLNIEDQEDQRKIAQAITGKFLLSFMSKLNQKG